MAELREERETGELLRAYHGLPWETESECTKFQYFLLCPRPRSVRKAYRLWCEDNGIEPNKDPPKSWYRAYRGDYAAFRKAERQLRAIKRAEKVHGRVPNWDRLELAATAAGVIGEHALHSSYTEDIREVQDTLILIEWAFCSLAVDQNGDPIPGWQTWEERNEAYWQAVALGQVDRPDEPEFLRDVLGEEIYQKWKADLEEELDRIVAEARG